MGMAHYEQGVELRGQSGKLLTRGNDSYCHDANVDETGYAGLHHVCRGTNDEDCAARESQHNEGVGNV